MNAIGSEPVEVVVPFAHDLPADGFARSRLHVRGNARPLLAAHPVEDHGRFRGVPLEPAAAVEHLERGEAVPHPRAE